MGINGKTASWSFGRKRGAIRRKAYALFLEHRRKGNVAKLLNAAGYRTRGGSIWRDTQVLRILIDPSAKGIYRIGAFKYNGDWKREEKPDDQGGFVQLEPIVTEELWNQVNKTLDEQHKPVKRLGKKPVHLFAGLAICDCGGKMYVPANTPKYVCFKCRNKIPILDLENIFYDELKAYLSSHERISKHLLEVSRVVTEKQALFNHQNNEIQKVQDEMKRTHRLYLEGQVPLERFGEFYRPLEERLKQLQEDALKLQGELDYSKINNLSTEEVLLEAEDLYSRWPKLPREEKRQTVERIIKQMVIKKDKITITFTYTPTSEELTNSVRGLCAAFAALCG